MKAYGVSPQLSALRYGAVVHKGDPCRIARLVGSRTCAQVRARIQRGLPPGQLALSIPGSPPPPAAPKRPNNKRKVGAPQRRKNASQVLVQPRTTCNLTCQPALVVTCKHLWSMVRPLQTDAASLSKEKRICSIFFGAGRLL